MESAQTDFISVINSLLLLVDCKSDMLAEVRSGDRDTIRNSALASARAAVMLNVPVILTSAGTTGNDEFLNDLASILPKQDPIFRLTGMSDALADPKVKTAISKFGRSKLIIGGLWTSQGFSETALSAIIQGYDVFGLIDATGDISSERHNAGIHRVLKAGLTPITWMSLASEWMHGWSEPAEVEEFEIPGKYNVMLSCLSKM
jgi:nicotinamidase-related amidase